MPRKQPVDPLESLLSEALRYAAQSKILRSDLAAKEAHRLIQSSYGNPDNWSGNRCVELVHRSPGGELSHIGFFREEFYRQTAGRRLRPWGANPPKVGDAVEFVSGNHWLSPQPEPLHQFEATPGDLLELQNRFNQLIEEFDERTL